MPPATPVTVIVPFGIPQPAGVGVATPVSGANLFILTVSVPKISTSGSSIFSYTDLIM